MSLARLHKSLFGKELALTRKTGALVSHDHLLNSDCGDAVITVGAENTNVRNITIQLKDWKGNNLTHTEAVVQRCTSSFGAIRCAGRCGSPCHR